MFYIASRGDKFDFAVDLFSGYYGYSHVELFFSNGMSFSSSPRDGGCRFKVISYDDKWIGVDIPMSPQREYELALKCMKYEGKKYDWLGIFLYFLIPAGIEDGSRWWCSEVCAKVLDISKYRITPNKMAKMFDIPRQKFHIPTLSFSWDIS